MTEIFISVIMLGIYSSYYLWIRLKVPFKIIKNMLFFIFGISSMISFFYLDGLSSVAVLDFLNVLMISLFLYPKNLRLPIFLIFIGISLVLIFVSFEFPEYIKSNIIINEQFSLSFGIISRIALSYNIISIVMKAYEDERENIRNQNLEIQKFSDEITTQNEELTVKNEHINMQRDQLELAQDKLKKMNNQLEKLVKKRTRKLEKAVEELDRFVYSASHDLSAPLKSIRGVLNLASKDTDPHKTREYLLHINLSIDRLDEVIRSLLTYSRNSNREIILEKTPLKSMTEEIIRELSFMPQAQKIKFSINIDDEVVILTDLNRIKTIFTNLIQNCIKYADFSKKDPTVTIQYTLRTSNHFIEISDNGIGIDEKHMNEVFKMFYRATEKSEGSGLGLFIVKETLFALKGKISVASTLGKGTTFKITLPRVSEV